MNPSIPMYIAHAVNSINSSHPTHLLKPILFGLAISSLLTGCDTNTPNYKTIEGQTMGTSYHITYRQPDNADSTEIQQSVDARLKQINDSMSTYQDDSIISKFNALSSNQPMTVDADFINVLQDAKKVHTQSQGAFDPTVMPLINLWGFGKTQTVERLQSPPNPEDIAAAKALIDFDSIQLSDDTLIKTKDGVALDFSAIAKGYGVDVIANVLNEQYHINNYMVEIGGEVATSGVNSKAQPWQIAIDAPVVDSSVSTRETIAIIRQPQDLGTLHLATSGNYRNSVVFDGKRYSHTIDPIAGQPIAGGAPSVSVVADSVTLADAWATALTAMPYMNALKTANEHHLAALFIVPKDGEISDEVALDDASKEWKIVETTAMQDIRNAAK